MLWVLVEDVNEDLSRHSLRVIVIAPTPADLPNVDEAAEGLGPA